MSEVSFLDVVRQSRPQWAKFCDPIRLPRMRRIQQKFPRDAVEDVPGAVKAQLEASGIKERIRPGAKIAVCCGSRGLANLPALIRATVEWVRAVGGDPFVVPAMGSHGGASDEGQAAMLASLGVTAESVGAPVVSHLDTEVVDEIEGGYPVHVATDVMRSDGAIIVCRVKPHTAFRGEYESGFMKMLVIGVGKHNGALATHHRGFGFFARVIPLMGQSIVEHAPILGGLGVIENAFYQTANVTALRAEQFKTHEPGLLKEAFRYMGKIYFDDLDVLVVDELGKDYSGAGMDPNITGTFTSPYGTGGVKSESKVVFGISEPSHGNASGLGTVDFTTPNVFAAFDPISTYTNAMTARISISAKIPLVMPDEETALRMAIHKSTREHGQDAPRIVHIENTEQVEFINISEALWEEADECAAFVTDPFAYRFDASGTLIRDWSRKGA